MKQFNLLSAFAVLMLSSLLFSCSPSGSESFAKRKYFDYKWDKKEYVKVETEKAQPAPTAEPAEEIIIDATASAEAPAIEESSMSVKAGEVTAPSRTSSRKAAPKVTEENQPAMSFSESDLSFGEKLLVKKLEKAVEKKRNEKQPAGGEDILLILLCIFLPPLAVFIKNDGIDTDFWITLVLWLLFALPGIIYAFYVCFFK